MRRFDVPATETIGAASRVLPRGAPAIIRLALLCAFVTSAGVLGFKSYDWATKDDNPRDFGSFWESGRAASRGADPYGVYPLTFRVGSADGPAAPNLNPPLFLYPFEALGRLSIGDALRTWRAVSLALYAVCVAAMATAMPRRRLVVFAAVALNLAGFWHTVELGQVYVPLLCLAVAGSMALRDGNEWRGAIAVGLLAALKPNFAVWPALLLIGGRPRLGVRSFAVAAVASALPLALQGPRLYEEWLRVTPSLSDAGEGMARIGGNFALVAMAGRFGVEPAGLAASAALAAALAFVAFTKRLTLEQLSGLALVGALLLGPVTWVGYSILLLPVLASMRWTVPVAIAAALLCVPFWAVIDLGRYGDLVVQVVQSCYGVAALLLMAALMRQALAMPTRRGPLFRLPGFGRASARSAQVRQSWLGE